MIQVDIQIEKILEPSDKVLLMYQAISRFMQQKLSLNSLKVSDITREAGIGKGTAYEYFSSKEDLITHALLFECSRKMQEAEQYIFAVGGFEARLNRAFDWIYENRAYHEMVSEVLRLNMESGCEKHEMPDIAKNYLRSLLDRLMEDGCREGIIRETDPQRHMLSMASVVMGYLIYVSGGKEDILLSLEEAKTFLIRTLIRSLN